ncbi:MAG: cytochrome P450 [Lewinellaceae bacterium]|nr:cytochrome P450 [Lewinellaceae bacterium]MCB9289075.1 cytochrome P450 [Lewinellaceae bacterium]
MASVFSSTLPSIPRWKSLRNSLRFAHNPIATLDQYISEYGPTYEFHLGGMVRGILTTDPGLAQHVLQKEHRKWRKSPIQTERMGHFLGNGLLTSDGEYWLRQRRLIQPGFHRKRLAALTTIMNREIDEFLNSRFEPALATGEPIDMSPMMMELAFRVVAKSLFNTGLDEEGLNFLGDTVTILQGFITRTFRQPYLIPWLRFSGQYRKHELLAEKFEKMILERIQGRRASGERHDDLLQMLLEARYEDTGEGMTDRQLLEESAILFVAGHETTANALSWAWHLLARHPEAVERLRREHNTVLGGREPAFEDLPRLEYTQQVIDEAMRLYPPAWITDRLCVEDGEYGGLPLPKGSRVVIYIWGIHRKPGLWEAPEAFRPERFSRERKGEYHPFAYMPFGGGPRLCIGNNFALMEMQLVLVKMLQRYEMSEVPGFEPGLQPLITLRPGNGVLVQVEKR